MKTFPTDSAVVARAREDLLPIVDQLVEVERSLQEIAERLRRAEKYAVAVAVSPFDGEKDVVEQYLVEEWIADDVKAACSGHLDELIKAIRYTIRCDFRSEMLGAMKMDMKIKAKLDFVAYLVGEIGRSRDDDYRLAELRAELIPVTTDPASTHARLKGRAETFAKNLGLTAAELEDARGCPT